MTEKPKRRWIQFSLRTFLLLAVAAAVLFALEANRRTRTNMRREAARHMVAHELLQRHALGMETLATVQPFTTQMYDDLLQGAVDKNWNYRFIPAVNNNAIPQGAAPADRFEKTALAEMQAGGEELWQTDRSGAARYAKAIRATGGCGHCHFSPTTSAQPTATPPDLLGVVVIELPPQ